MAPLAITTTGSDGRRRRRRRRSAGPWRLKLLVVSVLCGALRPRRGAQSSGLESSSVPGAAPATGSRPSKGARAVAVGSIRTANEEPAGSVLNTRAPPPPRFDMLADDRFDTPKKIKDKRKKMERIQRHEETVRRAALRKANPIAYAEEEDKLRERRNAVALRRIRRWRDKQYEGFQELKVRLGPKAHELASFFVRPIVVTDHKLQQKYPMATAASHKRTLLVSGVPISRGRMTPGDLHVIFNTFGDVSFAMMHPSLLAAVVCFKAEEGVQHACSAARWRRVIEVEPSRLQCNVSGYSPHAACTQSKALWAFRIQRIVQQAKRK